MRDEARGRGCLLLVLGQSRPAVVTPLNRVGSTGRCGRELVPIGGPECWAGGRLVGQDAQGKIEGMLAVEKATEALGYEFSRAAARHQPPLRLPQSRHHRANLLP